MMDEFRAVKIVSLAKLFEFMQTSIFFRIPIIRRTKLFFCIVSVCTAFILMRVS